MGRIADCFATLRGRGEAALVPFIMAGDPDLDATRTVIRAAVEAGADLLELGVPFSDPTADGPVNQRAAARALQRGTSLRQILEMAVAHYLRRAQQLKGLTPKRPRRPRQTRSG